MTPRVSVVVATRNRRAMLARALASVDAQTFRDYEIVVVDDGSTDGTATWLAAARPTDRLIAVAPARGAAAARNHGAAGARGAIVAFLDDDDVWLPRYLAAQVAQLDADPRADLGTTGHVEVDPAGQIEYPDLRPLLATDDALVQMLAACPIHTLSVVACRRVALARIGLFDETLEVVHDLDWYLRLLMAGGRIVNDPTPLVERAIPGGLVSQYRRWYAEERALHRRAFEAARVAPACQRWIRAARALLFARIALGRRDFAFALARIGEAMATAPIFSAQMAATRLLRHRRGAFAWNARAAAR